MTATMPTRYEFTVASPEWFDEAKRRHGNYIAAGRPVMEWETFARLATQLSAANDDLRATVVEVSDLCNRVVPPADQYVAFLKYEPEPVRQLFDLLLSDVIPNFLHPSDCQFVMTYGKKRLNPQARMERRLKELARATIKLRKDGARLYREALKARIAEHEKSIADSMELLGTELHPSGRMNLEVSVSLCQQEVERMQRLLQE